MYNKNWFNNTAKDTVVSITRVVKGIESTIIGYYRGASDECIVVFTYDEESVIYIIPYFAITNVIVYTEEDVDSIDTHTKKQAYFNNLEQVYSNHGQANSN